MSGWPSMCVNLRVNTIPLRQRLAVLEWLACRYPWTRIAMRCVPWAGWRWFLMREVRVEVVR